MWLRREVGGPLSLGEVATDHLARASQPVRRPQRVHGTSQRQRPPQRADLPSARAGHPAFHSTRYVDTLIRAQNLPSTGHDIGDRFTVSPIDVTVTPADHAWQNDVPGAAD
jgi:hypothetical protein